MTTTTARQRLKQYALLMRMDKPIGSLLLLWPTLWALWLAGDGFPDPLILSVFVLGVFLMRSAGCVINDIADRNFDPHVERTRERPLASRRVSLGEAIGLFVGLSVAAFALVLTLNWLTIALSIPGIVLAASYPLMKRFTYLPQAYLGVAFGWGIPMAYAAHLNAVPLEAWYLLAVNIVWAIAYDTMYAMADRADDLKIGVKSSAILFGTADRAIVGFLQAVVLGLFVGLGLYADLGLWYAASVTFATGAAIYQQILIRAREPADCFKAFLNNNWLGGAIFVGLFVELTILAGP
ncbi:MAG: 4-hydroxybenzoate octaprenyltransferase [Pseudomonadota bacterium]